MPQYIVICRMQDPLDPELQRKRAELRPAHIEGASKLQAEGKLLLGGMVQDQAGNPAGSGCICNFDNEAALWEWLDNDPWMLGGVWHSVEVIPFKVAEHYLKH